MRFKDILITGGAGFVGSHLSEKLLDQGCRVTIIDDLSTGRWSNIAHLEGREDFRALVASASDERIIETEVPKHDFVYHLASAVGVRLIIEKPVNTVENIFRSTDVVFRYCARYRRPVLVTSTSEVYGKSSDFPFNEAADVVMGPTEKRRWAYACAKALDEFLALAHHYESALPTYVVRLFNTVGPRQVSQYGMVLPTFVKQALQSESLTVFGDGTQRRCFCSVHDIADGLVRLAQTSEGVGRVVNLGSQEEISIYGLAEKVIKLAGSQSEIRRIPYSEAYGAGFDDMPRRIPDLTRAKDLIGWNPRYSLEDIILATIKEFRDTGPE
ncbi:MAG: NAD-dependent epimerase/dehydratase family protein [Actinomycetota bacterium]